MKRLYKTIMTLIILVSLSFIFVKVKHICHNQKTNDYEMNYVIKNEDKVNEPKEKIGFETEVIIVVGAVVISGGLGFVLYWFIYKKKNKKE